MNMTSDTVHDFQSRGKSPGLLVYCFVAYVAHCSPAAVGVLHCETSVSSSTSKLRRTHTQGCGSLLQSRPIDLCGKTSVTPTCAAARSPTKLRRILSRNQYGLRGVARPGGSLLLSGAVGKGGIHRLPIGFHPSFVNLFLFSLRNSATCIIELTRPQNHMR